MIHMKKVTYIPIVQKEELESKKKKLKVAVYCRVSTLEERQMKSYVSQIEWYTKMILKNPEWEFAGVFADKGKSGLGFNDRSEFKKMIRKAMKGEIDLIITKSISRFSRNTLDSLNNIRKLKERKIAVYFEREDINTLDEKGGLLMEIMCGLAQEEIRNMSENIKWGYQRRFESGKILTKYKNFMGYTCENDELVIVQEQAIIVEKIFDLYLEGKTLNQIKEYLERNNIKTVTGKESWHTDTIDKMLNNEKYMGDSMLQKTCSVNFLSKKRLKNDGRVNRYYVANSHPEIISKEKFEKVQEEKKKRDRLIKNEDGTITVNSTKYNGKYLLGNLLVCGECGASYRRRTERGKVMLRCATRIEKGRASCESSPTLEEEHLKDVVVHEVFGGAGYYDGEKLKKDVRSIKVYEDKLIIVLNTGAEREVAFL